MLSESHKNFILEIMDRQLCAVANGGVDDAQPTGFATSSDAQLEGIDFATICSSQKISYEDFVEARKADHDFDSRCATREMQIGKMLVGRATKAAFHSTDPKQIAAVAERLDKDFSPASRNNTTIIGEQNNFVEAWLGGKKGAELRRAIELMEETDRKALATRDKANRAIAAIEAKVEIVQ